MKPQGFFTILIGASLLVAAGGGFGYRQLARSVGHSTHNLRQVLAETTAADDQADRLEGLRQTYTREVVPLLPKLDAALPKTKQQQAVSLELSRLAADSGLTLTGLTYPASTTPGPTSQTAKAGDILYMTINFELAGKYDQINGFVQRLENYSHYANITSLNQTAKSDLVSAAINLNVFLKP